MKKTIVLLTLLPLAFLPFSTPALDWEHYNHNPNFKPAILPNGAVANMDALQKGANIMRTADELKAVKIIDNVWFFHGEFYAPVVIETDEGLLVFSTGEHAEDGTNFRKAIREQISNKPVIGVFYDHAHYPKGTRTLLDGDEAIIVAHPDSNTILSATGAGLSDPNIGEMGPSLDARAAIHFGAFAPKDGPDAMAAPLALEFGHENAWMPATKTLEHGESMTIAGLEIQAFHANTDSADSLTFWIPELKLVIDNVVWPAVNTYTLRGDSYRPPEFWMDSLRQIRDLYPEIVLNVGAGAKELVGKENIQKTVTSLGDSMAFIYDQSIRLTNMGVHPAELKHYIKMPDSLLASDYVNEVYGQWDTFPQAFPTWNAGWFSGYAEDIHALPKPVYSAKFVELAGGDKQVMTKFKQAFADGKYLWAKELATNLYYADPSNKEKRQALADTFRKLGQYSAGSIVRNFYLAGAISLEGNNDVTLGGVQTEDWVKADTMRAVNYLRTRINPEKSIGVDGVLVFNIDGNVSALSIRNSIAEFIADADKLKNADATISISADIFAKYYRGEVDADALITEGNTDALALISVFDTYRHVPMYPSSFNIK